MLEVNCDSLLYLIDYSNQLHRNQIIIFRNYLKKEKNNAEKWFELLYSILVGTQIKTSKVKYCFKKLLNEYNDILHPKFLIRLEDYSYLKEIIENSLKTSGYRFYKTKSETIYNTFLFFENYSFEIDNFLKVFSDYKSIRNELMKISGVGYKIASHWLRNLGYYIPVIDIHIKNLLSRFKVIEEKKLNYLTYESIQNEIVNKLNIDNITFDLSLWYYGKNFCGNRRCRKCKFYTMCNNNL